MIKPFKDWEIHKVTAVIVAVSTVVGAAYTKLPFHATLVLVLCIVLASFIIFYPWRFPTWVDTCSKKADDSFYPVMKLCWISFFSLSALVGVLWTVTNVVWEKSPDILAERMQETHLDVQLDLKLAREGVWDAKLVQQTPVAPQILVALPPLDKNRLPQSSDDRRCVPAIQAFRVAFGDLSTYSSNISLLMGFIILIGLPVFVGAERMHEAALKAIERGIAANKGRVPES